MDGRGTLSDKGLRDFCDFFLRTMKDQMDFMSGLLKLDKLLGRYERLMTDTYANNANLYFRIIKEIWTMGEMPRGKAAEVTGKSERTARNIISKLEQSGFVKSDSPKKPLRINISSDTAESIFPNLFIA